MTSAPPFIRVDRPFLLVLRERLSGTILFIGQISNIPPAA
ncbi:MAG: serpin family protein [Gemmatimonadales bacterium]